jgi:hypothetical protein
MLALKQEAMVAFNTQSFAQSRLNQFITNNARPMESGSERLNRLTLMHLIHF